MQKRILASVVISFCMYAATIHAQETGQVVAPPNGEYIREWLVLGPFFPDDLETDFLAGVGGEANIQPQAGDTITTAAETKLTWRYYETSRDSADVSDAIGQQEHATAYAFCIVQSEIAGDAQVCLGHSNGAVLYINGERAYSNPVSVARDQSVFSVNLKAGINRFLVKVSQELGIWALAMRVFHPNSAVISGVAVDEKGKSIAKASVRLEQDGEEVAQAQTDDEGSYCLGAYPAHGLYDLSATSGNLGDRRMDILLRAGERQRLDFTLREIISIEGTLLMLDDMTPHVAALVEAVTVIRDDSVGRVAATTLSDNGGRYRFINLKPGLYQVRCQVQEGYVYYGEEKAGKPESQKAGRGASEGSGARGDGDMLRVESGKTLSNVDFRFAPFKKGTWRTYHTLDGLADNGVLAIHADLDGVMWFGTLAGLSRYDGSEFVNLTTQDGLAGNWVFAIHVDVSGVMWFGTNGGVSRYDGRGMGDSPHFVNFTTEDGLASNVVKTIYRAPDGYLWFGTGWWNITGGGVSRYDDRGMGDSPHFVNFTTEDGLAHNTITAICSDSDGAMWFGTWDYGVSRYDGKEFVNFTTKDGLAGNGIYTIHRDRDGSLWFGTDKGVSRYDGQKFVNFTTKDGLANDRVLSIHRAPDGSIWFGTAGGVSRYDGKTFLNFTEEDGLVNNNAQSIYCASDDVLWFGTNGNGVSRYDGEAFLNLTEKDGLVNNNVQCVHRDPDGVMWIGTMGGGVSRYDGEDFSNLTEADGLAGNFVMAIHRASDSALWFGTDYSGVSRYDGAEFSNLAYQNGLAHNRVLSIHGAPDGSLWFGTWGGVSRYDGEEFVNFTIEDGLANNWVYPIYRDSDGIMWFGTIGGGVSRYDGIEFTTFTTADGLADNGVYAIHQAPDDTMWFGTLGGVSHYDGRGMGDSPHFVNLTAADGLAHNSVTTIYRASNGALWFGTLGGVSRYDGGAWTSLDTRDGLAGNSIRSIHEDADGSLWFGSEGGITRYRRSSTQPRVRIVSVRTPEQLYTEHTELLAIPPITVGDHFTVHYSAIDLKTIPGKRQYRYRIKELDSDWREPTKATQFEWTPGKAGTYTFEVQAIDRDLNHSEPASISIIISSPPFYHTGVFLLILSITGGASLFGIIVLGVQRRRSSRAHKVAEQVQAAKMGSLRQLVTGVAHQMNNPIGVITSNSDVSSRAIGKIEEIMTEKYSREMEVDKQLITSLAALEKMNQVSQSASEGVARIVANLRRFVRLDEAEWQYADIHEGMDNVIALMESEFSNRIRVTRDYGEVPRIHCSPSSLNQVFMSLLRNASEAIEGEGEINLRTSVQEKHVIVEISDTGRGIPSGDMDGIFDPGFTTKGARIGVGLGLSICYKIVVDEHRGRIDVSSEPGKGTTFTITLPQYRH